MRKILLFTILCLAYPALGQETKQLSLTKVLSATAKYEISKEYESEGMGALRSDQHVRDVLEITSSGQRYLVRIPKGTSLELATDFLKSQKSRLSVTELNSSFDGDFFLFMHDLKEEKFFTKAELEQLKPVEKEHGGSIYFEDLPAKLQQRLIKKYPGFTRLKAISEGELLSFVYSKVNKRSNDRLLEEPTKEDPSPNGKASH